MGSNTNKFAVPLSRISNPTTVNECPSHSNIRPCHPIKLTQDQSNKRQQEPYLGVGSKWGLALWQSPYHLYLTSRLVESTQQRPCTEHREHAYLSSLRDYWLRTCFLLGPHTYISCRRSTHCIPRLEKRAWAYRYLDICMPRTIDNDGSHLRCPYVFPSSTNASSLNPTNAVKSNVPRVFDHIL